MSNTINHSFDAMDDQNNKSNNSEQPQEPVGYDFGSLANKEQESNTSIGSGTSDQGIEPGEEGEEDEFQKGVLKGMPGADFTDEMNETSESEQPAHGLVEEGPGPDS